MSWQSLITIGSGAFIGAILRVKSIEFINSHLSYGIPLGVVFVNVFGSLIAGGLIAFLSHFDNYNLRSFLMTGLLGAFTTYSTFAIESILLINQIKFFAIYTLSSVIGSILFAFIGYKTIIFTLK
jgi:CrcB protein